jgi:hypothetical protein
MKSLLLLILLTGHCAAWAKIKDELVRYMEEVKSQRLNLPQSLFSLPSIQDWYDLDDSDYDSGMETWMEDPYEIFDDSEDEDGW